MVNRWSPAQIIIRVLSVIVLLPIIALITLVIGIPLTISGVLYLVGFIGLIVGVFGLAWGYTRLRLLIWLGIGLIVTVAVVRVFLLKSSDKIKLLILPEQSTACWLN